VNAAGTRLYVTNDLTNNVTVFTLDASGNVAGTQPGSPFATGGVRPRGVAVNAAGTRLYVANLLNNTATVFTLDAGGNVTGPGSLFPTRGGPRALVAR